MEEDDNAVHSYDANEVGRLELLWGEGFLSPGGPAEVSRILGGRNISGDKVLDIGSGSGGVDIVLVQEHDAGTVLGIDVEDYGIEISNNRARQLNLEDRAQYQLVKPGPLPFADDSFDVVFSKDAIIHIEDKRAIYSEALRVLRPGGWLLVSDWLAGEGESIREPLEEFLAMYGSDFFMASLREIGDIVQGLGFVEIELEDRQPWYLEEATAELQKLRGPLKSMYVESWGEEGSQSEIEFWENLVKTVRAGALRPGHIRAKKAVVG